MAALEFPATPSVGDTYAGDNSVIYTWTGVYWSAADIEDLQSEFVNVTGDTMTGNLVVKADVTANSYNTGPLAGFRNQLINGNYSIKSPLPKWE